MRRDSTYEEQMDAGSREFVSCWYAFVAFVQGRLIPVVGYHEHWMFRLIQSLAFTAIWLKYNKSQDLRGYRQRQVLTIVVLIRTEAAVAG